MNSWKDKQKGHKLSQEIPYIELNLLQRIPWDDASLPILKSWCYASIVHFLQTGYNLHSNCYFIQRDLKEIEKRWDKSREHRGIK